MPKHYFNLMLGIVELPQQATKCEQQSGPTKRDAPEPLELPKKRIRPSTSMQGGHASASELWPICQDAKEKKRVGIAKGKEIVSALSSRIAS